MDDATVVVGSIKSVTVESREFPVAADSDAELDTGGYENTVETMGSGNSIITQTRVSWRLANVSLVISDDRGDLGFLAGLFNQFVAPLAAALPFSPNIAIETPPTGPDREFLGTVISRGRFIPVFVTLADGTTYAGRGTIVGRIPTSTQTGLASVTFEGDGAMVKQ